MKKNCKLLVKMFIISRIDFCNAFYYGLRDRLLHRLQKVQNTAARLVSCIHKFSHIALILIKLHLLPIQKRLKLKYMKWQMVVLLHT